MEYIYEYNSKNSSEFVSNSSYDLLFIKSVNKILHSINKNEGKKIWEYDILYYLRDKNYLDHLNKINISHEEYKDFCYKCIKPIYIWYNFDDEKIIIDTVYDFKKSEKSYIIHYPNMQKLEEGV